MILSSYDEDKLQNFLSHFNSMDPKFKSTMEIENLNQLPFLDVLVIEEQDGILRHTVYRKAMHTNRYLNTQSHRHPAQAQGKAKTLVSRSQRSADADYIRTIEVKHILRTNSNSTLSPIS
ncbi:hypothetical protein Trydic_g4649 [Trypoxylus dichotomus]